MARARNIKPAFFTNDELSELSPLARLLFIGLWTIADYKGCFEYKPKRLKVQLLPYDDCDIEQLVSALDKSRFISIYSVQGQTYGKVLNFNKHQNPHKNEKEKGSDIPDIELRDDVDGINSIQNNGLENIENNHDKNGTAHDQNETDPADSLNLIPDSLNPDSLNLNTENRDPRFDLSLSDVNTRLSMAGLKNISQHDLNVLLIQLQDAYSHKKQMVKNQILGKAFEWIKRQQETPLATPKQNQSQNQDKWSGYFQNLGQQESSELDITPKKSLLIEEVGHA
ncbi:hypothetical protein H0S56_06245 [Acinetobacter lwoffii]|uniref:hypothetical protein n=1 Tax=Acinetobacter lwoffii TaxID=28090 RepID=UPI00189E299A|nr:hypothetical protein [Acinetobacter lwoffii]QPF33237.1 hypothetical protein H0S56_06245 [Acinetobacter lwoffii]